MSIATGSIPRGELRLLALAAVNEELDRQIAALAAGERLRLSGIAYQDRVTLMERALENEFTKRGITII
jgi:hypothetical protein